MKSIFSAKRLFSWSFRLSVWARNTSCLNETHKEFFIFCVIHLFFNFFVYLPFLNLFSFVVWHICVSLKYKSNNRKMILCLWITTYCMSDSFVICKTNRVFMWEWTLSLLSSSSSIALSFVAVAAVFELRGMLSTSEWVTVCWYIEIAAFWSAKDVIYWSIKTATVAVRKWLLSSRS